MSNVNVKEIILRLKDVRTEKAYTFQDIMDMMEQNGDYLSKSTLSRVFADGSEDKTFKYEETIRPIAKVLLDIETIEEDDTADIQAMKSILKYKIARINELETLLAKEQIKYHEKIEKERETFQRSLDFLKHQIDLKDKRMDLLLSSVCNRDEQNRQLIERLLDSIDIIKNYCKK